MPGFPMRILALRTEGMSSSDLKELCRNAAMLPIRESIRRAEGDVSLLAHRQEKVRLHFPRLVRSVTRCTHQGLDVRPLTIGDFSHPDVTSTIGGSKDECSIM